MGFIHLLSLFAACHAAQEVEGRTNTLSASAGREANKDATVPAPITTLAPTTTLAPATTPATTPAPITGDDGDSLTHGRLLARKTTRSLVVKRVHKWMNNFNPVNLEPSALVYAVKHDDLLGSEIQIVQWFFKLSVIFSGVDIFGVLVCGTIYNILAFVGAKYVPLWFWQLYAYGATSLAGSLTIPTLYALWAVPDQRVPYLVMLIVMWAAYGIFFSSTFVPGIAQYVVNIIFIFVYGFVGWFNWYKVLFPTWTGWAAKHWPQ